ncbi:EGF-like repeat and discoidin I-like domain-containing protein 3 [Acropora palmata]|uniref:EGF-like repeat and discoidin I-like domain-containing protein 3 n=1 Tax=Acropora palmata TaxID=6131 RepID=UPI003DA119C3
MKQNSNTLIWVVIVCGSLLTQGQENDEVCRPEPFAVHPHHVSASSSQGWYPAQYGLITENVVTAWCAAEKDTRQWLQIDLQENKDLLALALQGLYGHSWVESFYLQYSVDEETWYCYGSEKGHKVSTTINGVDCRNLYCTFSFFEPN